MREPCELLEQPQPLVSYHLRELQAERLVAGRSAFDGRESYYLLDLGRCRELLAESGGAIPACTSRGTPRHPPGEPHAGDGSRCCSCVRETAPAHRSPRRWSSNSAGAIEAVSAGSHPKPLHPNTVRVMRQRRIDPSGRRSKHLSEFARQRPDYVISLCDRAREVCPEFPGHPSLILEHPRPGAQGGSDEETYLAFERTADELSVRIPFLLELIEHDPSTQEVST